MMRVSFIWIFGLLGSAIIGGIIGSRFDPPYGSAENAILGFLAGMFVFACARLWLGKRERKPTIGWAETYANNIYEGLVADNDVGNITALSLRIPTVLHQAYHNKILLQRELICFFALMVVAKPETLLPPVHGRIRKSLGFQVKRSWLADDQRSIGGACTNRWSQYAWLPGALGAALAC